MLAWQRQSSSLSSEAMNVAISDACLRVFLRPPGMMCLCAAKGLLKHRLKTLETK